MSARDDYPEDVRNDAGDTLAEMDRDEMERRESRAEAEAQDAFDLDEQGEDVNEDGSRYMGAEAHDAFYADLGVRS